MNHKRKKILFLVSYSDVRLHLYGFCVKQVVEVFLPAQLLPLFNRQHYRYELAAWLIII